MGQRVSSGQERDQMIQFLSLGRWRSSLPRQRMVGGSWPWHEARKERQ